MGLFVTRTYTDGVLDTRGYRLRCFVENLVCAAAAPLLLAVVTLFLGGGAGSAIVAAVGLGLAFVVATSVRTTRGAALGGLLVAIAIFLFLFATDWLFRNPIQRD
jgi:membrane associated rhomboid family serine protease